MTYFRGGVQVGNTAHQLQALGNRRSDGREGKPSVKWKSNALRHSYASYRFALTGDAGRVAGELGTAPPWCIATTANW